MGIHCEIKLVKPSNGAYVPGAVVSGAIKYAVDKDTVFDKITISLKGKGFVIIINEAARRRGRNLTTHRDIENYVDMDYVIYNNDKSMALPIGSYEAPFNFQLPQEIPASLTFNNRTAKYWVRSKIEYYVRIKFEKPGCLTFDKKFKKEFTVVSGIKPTLSTEPITHGAQSKLFQLFGGKESYVNIRATIEDSVIRPGGQVQLDYEISNETNLTLKSVETKLMEIYTFKCKQYRSVEMSSSIVGTDAKTAAIKSGGIQKDNVVINVPSERTSLEYSKIVARNYFVYITAHVPFPRQNVILKIPIQIGDEIMAFEDVQNVSSDEPPPSYWEAMGEDNKKEDMMDDMDD